MVEIVGRGNGDYKVLWSKEIGIATFLPKKKICLKFQFDGGN